MKPLPSPKFLKSKVFENNFFQVVTETFFETKIFEADTETFFETKVFLTDTETFFRDRDRYSQKSEKSLDTEKSRDEMSHSGYHLAKTAQLFLKPTGDSW